MLAFQRNNSIFFLTFESYNELYMNTDNSDKHTLKRTSKYNNLLELANKFK